jgi:uncharacterized protein
MLVLYVTADTENAGKTLVCAGLGKNWIDNGKKVGYLKPIYSDYQSGNLSDDKDIVFMQKILNLQDTPQLINPIIGVQSESSNLIKQSLTAVASDKEVVLVEGLPLSKSSLLIESLDAKVLIVHDYSTPLSNSLGEYKKLGSRLIGIIINKVPKTQLSQKKGQYSSELEKSGINLLGLLPEDRLLMSMSINDLAEAVQGKILNNPEKGGEIIENVMLGSSTFDRGPAYYNRKENKAVILWGERPGFRKAAVASLQSAAIQTSVKCIVIGNNGAPIPAVVQKAEEKQVPLISTAGEVKSLITLIENRFKTLKFNQEQKISRLLEIVSQNLSPQLLQNVQSCLK